MADTIFLTNTGKSLLTAELVGTKRFTYVAWGTGTTIATANDYGLETPAVPTDSSAVVGIASAYSTTTPGDTYQLEATIRAESSVNITEVVVLNQQSLTGSKPLIRATFDAISLAAEDSIKFTIRLKFS
jgi:hypothetical protein